MVVTGAGGGLGPAVVEALRGAGSVCHTPGRAELDLTDEAAVTRFYAALPDLWASVHVAGGRDRAHDPVAGVARERVGHGRAASGVSGSGGRAASISSMARRTAAGSRRRW